MADPIFAQNKASLQAKLRLTGMPPGSDGEAVFDEALLQVRTAIFQRLGSATVTTITATAYTESATTDAQILRLAAAQVELYGVKARLLRDAPAFFIEAVNSSEEAWNEEGLLREADGEESLIAYYENLFAQGLDALASGDDIEAKQISIRSFSPDNTAQKRIGQSIINGKGLGGLWPSST